MNDLNFSAVFMEDIGFLTPGALRFDNKSLTFKSIKAGKSVKVSSDDINGMRWQKLGNKPGLRVAVGDGSSHRFGGFKDSDLDEIREFVLSNWSQKVGQHDLFIKGWNYGQAEVKGKNIEFSWEKQQIFEIPCTAVSQCIANKNEAVLEFHQNENNPVTLMEMRLHMPVDPENDDDIDQVEEFKKAVLAYAGLEAETEQPITLLPDILCTTPRGRYDIKVYPTSISLHGKTYDYKIPVKTITRLFLVPHKDGRHVYFVLSLNPPIRQGQTRYSFMVFEFVKDDIQELELTLTDEQLEDTYSGHLQREMDGPLFENVSVIFKVVCNLKVTVPGSFIGSSGTPAIQCSHKQNPGLLYPMEKGFLFIHKPVMYIRFEEISSCHFARSDGGTVTRTFDFEIDLKNGTSVMFNAMEKEENNKLFDYLNKKGIKIRNSQRIGNNKDVDSSDDEIDPYKSTVKAEGRQRDESDDESTDEDYDLDKDLKKQKKNRDSSEGSGSEPDDEYNSGSEQDTSGSGESEPDEENNDPKSNKKKHEKHEKKEKKTVKKVQEKKGKGKKTKDPNEPKRPISAYIQWFTANRASIKEDGDSVAEVAKKGGARWKEMSSEDKKEWEEKAAKDKTRYEAEMKEYRKNGGAGSNSTSSGAKKSKVSSAGPSPSKFKSKEHISESDDSDEEKPRKKEETPASSDDESAEESDVASDHSDSD